MDDGQWQSEGPVMRGGATHPDLHDDSQSNYSPEDAQTRLLEEAEEVEQGPHPRLDQTHSAEEEECDSSRVEDEDEEGDSNSGAYRDSPTPSPSPTVSEGLLSPDPLPVDAAYPEGFSRSLVASLQELGEQGDHPLLPQCLHQIAESFIHEGDYVRAVRFIQLERLYHERLLSNLASLQEQWERRWSLGSLGHYEDAHEGEQKDVDAQHLEKLMHICRTHTQPAQSSQKSETSKVRKNSLMGDGAAAEESLGDLVLTRSSGTVMEEPRTCEEQKEVILSEDCSITATPTHPLDSSPPDATPSASPAREDERGGEVTGHTSHSDAAPDCEEHQPGTSTIGPGEMEDAVDTGREEQEVQEIPELEQEEDGPDFLNVSMLDDMAKRIQVEEMAPAAGLVSILKRSGSLEGPSVHTPAAPKTLSKRKVRFREPEEGLDHDEVGGDSWLLLLLLCLATVVISVGGTALYCTFGDAQSSVCTDFSRNVDFYTSRLQRSVDELKHWLSPSS